MPETVPEIMPEPARQPMPEPPPEPEPAPRSFLAPPGGFLIWLFILMELLVFGGGLVAFFVMRAGEPDLFATSQAELSRGLAMANTLVLLTSGYLVLLANHRLDAADRRGASQRLLAAGALGVLFAVLKCVEYADKLERGLTTATNRFFELYWLLTGFHLAHVVVGVLILAWFALRLRDPAARFEDDLSPRTGGAFWHMCDLIWVLIFPTIYLA